MKNIYLYTAYIFLGIAPTFLHAMEDRNQNQKNKLSMREAYILLSKPTVDAIVKSKPSPLTQSPEFTACITILNSNISRFNKELAFELFEDKKLRDYFKDRLNRLPELNLQETYETYKSLGTYAVMKALLDIDIEKKAKPDLLFSLFFNLNGQPIHDCKTWRTYQLHQAIRYYDVEEVKQLIGTYGDTIIAGSGHGSTTLPCAETRKYYLVRNEDSYELGAINQIIDIIKHHGGHAAHYDENLKCLVLE
jgi:hypothetical protein